MIAIPSCEPEPDRAWLSVPEVTCSFSHVPGPGYGIGLFCAKSSGFERHEHAGHRINLCLRGVEYEYLNGETRILAPGDVSVLPAGSPHGTTHDAGPLCWLAVALPGSVRLTSDSADVLGAITMPSIARLVHATCEEFPNRLHIESLLAEVEGCVAAGSHSPERAASWLDSTIEIIMDESSHLSSLAELADAVGVHRCHLARSVRARFDRTPGELLMDRRLYHAARLLSRCDEPIASIACQTGFFDQSHMGRYFKRKFGITPRAYRRFFRRVPTHQTPL